MEKVVDLSKGRTCPRCGAVVSAEDEFCSLCGFPLPKPKLEEVKETKPGFFRDYAPVRPSHRLSAKEPKRTVAKRVPSKRTAVLKRCPNCNTPIRDDLKFCPNCGFNLEVARLRLRMKRQGIEAPSYTRKDFFSFEGYKLEGVPMTALMLVIWAVWNFGIAVISSLGLIQPQLPPPLSAVPPVIFSIVVGLLALLSAIGLIMVIRPLFYVILTLVFMEVFVSLMQIIYASSAPPTQSPAGNPIFENFAAGLVGLAMVIGITIQLLRVHKYFTGTRV